MPNRVFRDELLTSERYWSVSPEARNLFASIVLSADDLGRYTGANFALRTRCMAGTVSAEHIEKLVTELAGVDLIRLYYNNLQRYIFVPRFKQRIQWPHSKCPDPPPEINDLQINGKHKITTDVPPLDNGCTTVEEKRSEEKKYLKPKKATPLSSSPSSNVDVARNFRQEAIEVLAFLNEKTGTKHRTVDATLKPIIARLKSGVTVQECRTMVMRKVHDWQGNAEMMQYLRPSTLFRPSNFENYLAQTKVIEP